MQVNLMNESPSNNISHTYKFQPTYRCSCVNFELKLNVETNLTLKTAVKT